MLAPSLALAPPACARASVALFRRPIFAPGKIVIFIIRVHLRIKCIMNNVRLQPSPARFTMLDS
jgi:hypothetical protein